MGVCEANFELGWQAIAEGEDDPDTREGEAEYSLNVGAAEDVLSPGVGEVDSSSNP